MIPSVTPVNWKEYDGESEDVNRKQSPIRDPAGAV